MPTHSAPFVAIPEGAPGGEPAGPDGDPAGPEAERRRFRELLELMPDHVMLFDRDERVLYANAAVARDLGIPAGRLMAHQPVELGFGAPEFEPFRREYHRVIETGEPITGERIAATPAGRRVYSYTMTPLFGPDGGVSSVMLTSRDVTPLDEARAALAESEAKYRNLVELAPDAILIHQDGTIVFANQTAAAMLGVASPGDLVGRHPLEIVHPGTRERVEKNIGMDLLGEGSPVTTVELLRRDGTTVTAEGRGAMIHYGGRPAVQVVFRDVTEQRRAEAALRESEDLFRRTFDQSPIGAALLLPDYTLLRANAALCRMLGYPEEELRRMKFAEYTHPDDLDADLQLASQLASGAIDRYELDKRYIRGDGTVVWGHLSVRYIRDQEGRILYLLPMVQDITEQKEAEAALRESERRLRDVLEISLDAVYRRDLVADRYDYLSPVVQEITGLSAEEFAALGIDEVMEMIHPDDRARVVASIEEGAEAGTGKVEYRLRHRDGDYRWVSDYFVVQRDDAGAPVLRGGVLRDVTAQKEAEAALAESGERLRLAQACAAIGIWEWHLPGPGQEEPREYVRGVDPSAGELRIDGWRGTVHPDDLERVEAERDAALARREPFELEFRYDDGSGAPRWMRVLGGGVFDGDGRLARVLGVNMDITERKRFEEALREREQTLQGIFRAAPVGIGMVSHRVITQANDQLCRMTGYSRDELLGQDARILYPDDETYATVGREKYAQIVAAGTGAVETRWRRKDGTVLDILVSSSPIDLERPFEDVVFNALDITRLRESERALERYMDELQRSNEELQRFAYVASHDLQEPLRSIISFSQLLERRYKGQLGEDADDYIEFIVEGGNRMQQLITDLLQLSRVETKARPLVPTDAGEVVADAIRLMETAIREAGATVEVGPMPAVMADAAQLHQVFTNLIGNALKYRRPDVAPGVRISAGREGRFWRFAVEDNGIGIEAEYFDRIFVIFQRLHTRDEYPGTGIGLAVVRKIVERHGGRIAVESTPGEGSTFVFTLPAA